MRLSIFLLGGITIAVILVTIFFQIKNNGEIVAETTPNIDKTSAVPQPSIERNETITVPITLHPIRKSGTISTTRTDDEILTLFNNTQDIWSQANIAIDVALAELHVDTDGQNLLLQNNWRVLYSYIPSSDGLHIFYLNSLNGPNGIAIPPTIGLVADITSVDDFRATAHEIGHLLGLRHTLENRGRLLYPGANGRALVKEEIETARLFANNYFTVQ